MEIKSCQYNIDTASIEIIYNNNRIISLYIPDVEEKLRTTPYSYCKLELLLENEPIEYVKMIIDGTMQEYLDFIDDIYIEQEKNIANQLEGQYSKGMAKSIAREILIYS